jgi:lysyl-tRNA synthetase class 2
MASCKPPKPPWRLTARSILTHQLRQWFWAEGFVEVDTPIAIRAPAPELHIEAIPVHICADGFGQQRSEARFLQPSPELAMKRLVAQGFERIFQIAPVFRDGDRSEAHAPEFRLLEWYRAHAPYTTLMDDCERLITSLAQTAQTLVPPAGPDDAPRIKHALWAAPAPWPRLTVDSCFRAHAGFSLLDALTLPKLRQAAAAQQLHHSADDTWDELFFRFMVSRIEPALARYPTPVFVTEFPAAQASLARLAADDPRVAERFELYAWGLELANAFGELTDPQQQRARFDETRQQRARVGRRDYPLDEAFLGALHAMPQTSGIALGLERLMMLLLLTPNIDAISFLPWPDA